LVSLSVDRAPPNPYNADLLGQHGGDPFAPQGTYRNARNTLHIDFYVALAGLIVGFTVGLTGMGGGALMTPILVLLFKIQPLAAVSSDLVAAMVMKPIGGGVHMRKGTVNWSLVRWLAIGSIPSAFMGVFVLRRLGDGQQVQDRLKFGLGIALVVAAASIVVKSLIQMLQARHREALLASGRIPVEKPFRLKRVPTLFIGSIGGLIVGMTSVGSGSLIIVTLLLLYPMLSSRELVGTDLVQAIPLVASAALAHILFGDFKLDLTASVLVGSIPGVYLGARLSSRAKDSVIRPALVIVLLASGLKLLNMPTGTLAVTLGAFVVVAAPVWAAIDAASRPEHLWELAGLRKRPWLLALGAGAPLGVGFAAAISYFASARRKLATAAILAFVAVRGDEVPAA
jgi:uncharacterized membrane protein YfcA